MKKVVNEAFYTANHEYVIKEGPVFKVGISDFGQTCFKEITIIDFPRIGQSFKIGECCCVLESSKAANEVEMPLSGTVIAVNEQLIGYPSLVNEDCYGKGWLIKIAPSNLIEWSALLSPTDYREEIGVFFRKIS